MPLKLFNSYNFCQSFSTQTAVGGGTTWARLTNASINRALSSARFRSSTHSATQRLMLLNLSISSVTLGATRCFSSVCHACGSKTKCFSVTYLTRFRSSHTSIVFHMSYSILVIVLANTDGLVCFKNKYRSSRATSSTAFFGSLFYEVSHNTEVTLALH